MPQNELEKTVIDLTVQINAILKDSLEIKKTNFRNDIRNLALLKALTSEIIKADPAAKARIFTYLDKLILHGDDDLFSEGIKQAVAIITAA